MKRNWQNAFFASLEETGSVTAACQAAHISREAVYTHKRKDQLFAERWEQALDAGADTLEDEARKRAMDSTANGSHVLIMFLLKGLRPQRWRESRATMAPAELNKLIDAEFDRRAKAKEAEDRAPIN